MATCRCRFETTHQAGVSRPHSVSVSLWLSCWVGRSTAWWRPEMHLGKLGTKRRSERTTGRSKGGGEPGGFERSTETQRSDGERVDEGSERGVSAIQRICTWKTGRHPLGTWTPTCATVHTAMQAMSREAVMDGRCHDPPLCQV